MATSARNKPAAKSVGAGKRVASKKSGAAPAKRGGASVKRGASAKGGASVKRGASGKGGAKRGASAKRSATPARRAATARKPKAPASRRARTPLPPARREPAREEDFISAFDLILSALGDFFSAYRREILMAALVILTLCDALTFTPAEGILVGWLSTLFRGLFGYGYLLSVPALLTALLIVWRWEDGPTGLPIACVLLLPFLFGMLGHLLLPGARIATNEGAAAFVGSLWESGQALISGGVLSGGIAELCRAFFSQFAALTLLLIVLYKISAQLGLFRPRRMLPERRGYVYDDYLDEDDAPQDYSPDDEIAYEYEMERPGLVERFLNFFRFRRGAEEEEEEDDDFQWMSTEARERERMKAAEPSEKPKRKPPKKAAPSPPPPAPEPETPTKRPPVETRKPGRKRKESAVSKIEEILKSFDVDAIPTGTPVQGPSITRYEFELGQGVKLSKIMNLTDDIALSLGSSGVRIAPIQNRESMVGIEVPNAKKTPVLLQDVIKSPEFKERKSKSTTTFALGKDISGDVVTGCIEELPHVLIAGTTGSGKSVCINSMIISLLNKSTPEQLRFIMIDPKMVELAPYKDIPHLLVHVITDPREAANALREAVKEMMKRYKLFSENGVKKLEEYNKLVQKKGKNDNLQPLPSIVVVIDELADLMMVAAKEVEESIMRVAQMGRAAGIHLVIATQRPSADVITGLMKANIPSRIAFAVASAMESRIILDSAGAEKLMGNGDMLYSPLGGEKKRVQGCYVSPKEIEDATSSIKKKCPPVQHDSNMEENIKTDTQAAKNRKSSAPQSPEEQEDELLPAAVDVVMETGQASTSMLQRRLKLGYSRAARLIDQMERRGYVGPFEGSRPRQLLITEEQWRTLKAGGAAPP